MADEIRPVAGVVTEWFKNSHADVLLGRLLEPEAWGHKSPYRLKLVSLYVDQFTKNDVARAICQKHGVPIHETVDGAIGAGTKSVAVDGVILIGEHGPYPENSRGQSLYPRRRLFEQIVHAFRKGGRRVPVFSDKHLSYDWPSARWMYDLARHEGIPFMAGSSVPLGWRMPELNYSRGIELASAFALAYSELDSYGFHALEALQCMVERRAGGETGVKSVRAVKGERATQAIEARERWAKVEAIMRCYEGPPRGKGPKSPLHRALFEIEYSDGLAAEVGMYDVGMELFGYSGRCKNCSAPDTCAIVLENGPPHGHFGHLLRAVEHMILTGKPAYPVERTLLTTGILAAALQSVAEGGSRIRTPHLAEVSYQPADWPFAKGAVGTPSEG